jgi:hypothetical protein
VSGDVESSPVRPDSAAAQPAVAAAVPIPEPTPVVPASAATQSHPPGTAVPVASDVIGPADRPELAVGAAFAGGLILALVLKPITN